jgi:hypothetical protein
VDIFGSLLLKMIDDRSVSLEYFPQFIKPNPKFSLSFQVLDSQQDGPYYRLHSPRAQARGIS